MQTNHGLQESLIFKAQVAFTIALSIWFGLALAASRNEWYRFLPNGFAAIVALGGLAALLLVYFKWRPFRLFIDSIPMKHLTLFHLWRIGAGLIFLDAYASGILPWTFARNAGWGDIFVGVLIPVLFLFPESRKKYLFFHLFSVADLLLAVGTGLVLRYITLDILMKNINLYPQAMMPLFGVPVTGALSMIAVYRLLKSKGDSYDRS